MTIVRSPAEARAPRHVAPGRTPYNEGWLCGAGPRGERADCPFVSPLVGHDRAEWLRGFAAGQADQRDA